MAEFYEPPAVNSAKKVALLFEERLRTSSKGVRCDAFVPYSHQRDHLGRLITAQKRESVTKAKPKCCSARTLPFANLISSQEAASSTIQRIFRRTHIGGQSQKFLSTDHKKNRIRSSSSKQLEIPAVGSYDAVDVADKMKYKKSREVVFSSIKRTNIIHQPPPPSTNTHKSNKCILYQEVSTQPTKPTIKAPLNYNLPQLQKYLEMKRLKVSLNQNFEQNHLKFKQLARKGLVLAKTIRNNIEFD